MQRKGDEKYELYSKKLILLYVNYTLIFKMDKITVKHPFRHWQLNIDQYTGKTINTGTVSGHIELAQSCWIIWCDVVIEDVYSVWPSHSVPLYIPCRKFCTCVLREMLKIAYSIIDHNGKTLDLGILALLTINYGSKSQLKMRNQVSE